jgi:hypothetical protein
VEREREKKLREREKELRERERERDVERTRERERDVERIKSCKNVKILVNIFLPNLQYCFRIGDWWLQKSQTAINTFQSFIKKIFHSY